MAEDVICSVKKRGRDLTVDTLKIAGKESVRDVIILTPEDAKKKRGGKCVFDLSYQINNLGYMSSKDFENIAYFQDKVVSRQHAVALGPNESKIIKDDIILEAIDGELLVRIDAFSKIAEDDETNNDITSQILFRGFDKKTPPQLHIEFLRIAGKTPVQGRVKVQKQHSKGEKKGRFSLPIEYVIRNYGNKAATGFNNLFTLDGKGFYRQKNITLAPGESKLVQILVYFPIHNGKFCIQMDAEKKYPKAPGCKRSVEAQVYFQGF